MNANASEYWYLALGALGTVGAGLLVAAYSRYSGVADRKEADEEKARKAVLAGIDARLTAESFERQSAVSEEASARRGKDEQLGDDISEIREEMCHYYGELGKPRPTFGRRPRGDR